MQNRQYSLSNKNQQTNFGRSNGENKQFLSFLKNDPASSGSLPNVGNTCFINSILQALYAAQLYRQKLIIASQRLSSQKYQYIRLVGSIFKAMKEGSEISRKSKLLRDFTEKLYKLDNQYRLSSQQDALKYFFKILNKIQKQSQENGNPLKQLFELLYQDEKCKCQTQFILLQQTYITIPSMRCQKCGQNRNIVIRKPCKYLLIIKNRQNIESNYQFETVSSKKAGYSLISTVNYIGSGLSGHYKSYRIVNGQWKCFNDSLAYPASQLQALCVKQFDGRQNLRFSSRINFQYKMIFGIYKLINQLIIKTSAQQISKRIIKGSCQSNSSFLLGNSIKQIQTINQNNQEFDISLEKKKHFSEVIGKKQTFKPDQAYQSSFNLLFKIGQDNNLQLERRQLSFIVKKSKQYNSFYIHLKNYQEFAYCDIANIGVTIQKNCPLLQVCYMIENKMLKLAILKHQKLSATKFVKLNSMAREKSIQRKQKIQNLNKFLLSNNQSTEQEYFITEMKNYIKCRLNLKKIIIRQSQKYLVVVKGKETNTNIALRFEIKDQQKNYQYLKLYNFNGSEYLQHHSKQISKAQDYKFKNLSAYQVCSAIQKFILNAENRNNSQLSKLASCNILNPKVANYKPDSNTQNLTR